MTTVDQIATFGRVNISEIFRPTSRLRALDNLPISGNQIVRVESVTGNGLIQGSVYLDNNGDGVHTASELGMARRQVFLDTNGSGAYDNGEPVTLTESDGSYTFRVGPGSYIVRLISVPDFQQTLLIGRYDTSLELGRRVNNLDFGLKYAGLSWTNAIDALDVNATEGVTLRDALQIVNEIRLRTVSNANGSLPELKSPPAEPVFYDVNADGNAVLSDVVAVINFLAVNPSAAARQVATMSALPLTATVGTAAEGAEIAAAEMPQDARENEPGVNPGLPAPEVAVYRAADAGSRTSVRPTAQLVLTSLSEQAFAELADDGLW
jgi:hypothetical protein